MTDSHNTLPVVLTVREAALNEGVSRDALIASVVARIEADKGSQDGARKDYISVYLERAWNITEAQVAKILATPGATSKGDGVKRTESQEKGYANARKFWQRVLQDAEIATTSNRGKGAKPRAEEIPEEKDSTPKGETTPVLNDMNDVRAFMQAYATKLTHVHSANAANFVGDYGMLFRDAIQAFHKVAFTVLESNEKAPEKAPQGVPAPDDEIVAARKPRGRAAK